MANSIYKDNTWKAITGEDEISEELCPSCKLYLLNTDGTCSFVFCKRYKSRSEREKLSKLLEEE